MELSQVAGYFFFFFDFLFWRVEVKVTCCSLEVFHEHGLFCVFILSGSLVVSFVFIFFNAEVNQLPGFYKQFICCSMEFSQVSGVFFIIIISGGLKLS